MDPQTNIQEQLNIAKHLAFCDTIKDTDDPLASRLAELVLALVEWRKSGGFEPDYSKRDLS